MELTTEKLGQTLLVKISGELDLSTSPLFRQLVEEELEQDPNLRFLVLDLNETSFIDSSGLGVILGRFKKITQKGGNLSFIRVPSHLSKVFELSGLMRIMEIHPSLEAALDKQ
ncbi:MAG TPA: anti-sigma factor antagonist [Bacillota bacterium]|nr:anti-sigma factor antagonist [Bacillota bacterium]